MYSFERVFGVGSPVSSKIFDNKRLSKDDLVHIYDELTAEDCALLSELIESSECWVRVSPKPGKCFLDLSWCVNLRVKNLWLDVTEDCLLSISDVESLAETIEGLYLPTRKGAFYKKLSLRDRSSLKCIAISGSLADLSVLSPLAALNRLVLDKCQITSLVGICSLRNLKEVQIRRSAIRSLEGIESLVNLSQLVIFDSKVKDAAHLSQCNALERVELVFVKSSSQITLPVDNRQIARVRLYHVHPFMDCVSLLSADSLEYLSADFSISELQCVRAEQVSSSLKEIFLADLGAKDLKGLNSLILQRLVKEERGMPFGF